ncbi:MAG TPA: hypothetical protein VIQ30_22470 [Pseudonocardia sp.]
MSVEDGLCGLCGCTYARCRLHAEYHSQAWEIIHLNPWTTCGGAPVVNREDGRHRTDFIAFIGEVMAYRKAVFTDEPNPNYPFDARRPE